MFCSEDLGAFYLDILKDRLYTTAAESHARRSAQTALWHITPRDAALDGAVPQLHRRGGVEGVRRRQVGSIFAETYCDTRAWDDAALLAKWARIARGARRVEPEIEALRSAGGLGSSLQAEVDGRAPARRRTSCSPPSATTCASC